MPKRFSVLIYFLITVPFAFSQPADSSNFFFTPDSLLNKPAPSFLGKSIKGNIFRLENFKGKVTLLNFWFIGCTPCMHEIPYLNSIYNQYSGQDFQLISVANNVKEDLIAFNDSARNEWMSNVRKVMKTETINYEIIPACSKRKKRKQVKNTRTVGLECDNITKDYFVHSYPTTYIIDKMGIVRYASSGFALEDGYAEKQAAEYKEIITRLLSESK